MILCPACGDVPKRLLVQDDDRTRDLVCRCGASICRQVTLRGDLWLFGSPVRWLVCDSKELQEWSAPSGHVADMGKDETVPSHLAGEAISRVVCSMVLSS